MDGDLISKESHYFKIRGAGWQRMGNYLNDTTRSYLPAVLELRIVIHASSVKNRHA
jgi:hypothetical protein